MHILPDNFNIREWYTVLIWDPDYSDTSPWSVKAGTIDEAVNKAKLRWYLWLDEEDHDDDVVLSEAEIAEIVRRSDNDAPDVFKIYKCSYIGEIV